MAIPPYIPLGGLLPCTIDKPITTEMRIKLVGKGKNLKTLTRSWDKWQTSSLEEDDHLAASWSPLHGSSPFYEEDFELEEEPPPYGTKHDRTWCNGSGDSSSEEEDPKERVMEDKEEEGEEEEEETGKVWIESVKFINTGNSALTSKGTPTAMDDCTIHVLLEGTYQKNSKQWKSVKFTIGARISIKPLGGWQKKYLVDTPSTQQSRIPSALRSASKNLRYKLMVHLSIANFYVNVSGWWRRN
jgi:hypothetical protein